MFTTDRQIDRRILLQADTLESAGWRVVIIAMPVNTPESDEDPRVVRIAVSGSVGKNRHSLAALAYRRLRHWIPMNSVAMRRLRALLWFLVVNPETFFLELFREPAARYPADIAVAHSLSTLPVAAAAARRSGGSLVFDSHELHVEQKLTRREKRIWTAIESRYIHRCDAVITVNPSIAAELERRYQLDKVHVVHNAERVSEDAPARGRLFHQHFDLPASAKILLYQGGLSSDRNLQVLAKAIGLVRTSDLHLVLLGDGVLAARLQRIAVFHGLQDRIHLHPRVPQNSLLAYTASGDAGVIPYQPNCENNRLCTPNKLFEFVAAGVPMVATDLPELRRLIVTNELGLVGDTKSPRSLAALIDRMLGDPNHLQHFRRGVMSARSQLSWQTESKALLGVYRQFVPLPVNRETPHVSP